MARLRPQRIGQLVEIKGRPFRFSYWPVYRGTRRWGMQAHLYATNPWALIRGSIQDQSSAPAKAEALACLEQAEYFYRSATAAVEWAAKPLLLYYSFLNLAKAFVLTRTSQPTLDQAKHGLSEQLGPGRREIVDAFLIGYPTVAGKSPNVFASFWNALTGHRLTSQLTLNLPALIPQVVAGHRLWCEATDSNERFMNVEAIPLKQDKALKAAWATLQVHSGTLSPHGITHAQLLTASGLSSTFREVDGFQDGASWMLQFQQRTPTQYSHRVSDVIQSLIDTFRHRLWATATTVAPYRAYYIYVPPTTEVGQVLPQLLGIYSISYYLGSITRYRPQHFATILDSDYGPFVQEFLSSQPGQFLYLLASEFARREVTRAELT